MMMEEVVLEGEVEAVPESRHQKSPEYEHIGKLISYRQYFVFAVVLAHLSPR